MFDMYEQPKKHLFGSVEGSFDHTWQLSIFITET